MLLIKFALCLYIIGGVKFATSVLQACAEVHVEERVSNESLVTWLLALCMYTMLIILSFVFWPIIIIWLNLWD